MKNGDSSARTSRVPSVYALYYIIVHDYLHISKLESRCNYYYIAGG